MKSVRTSTAITKLNDMIEIAFHDQFVIIFVVVANDVGDVVVTKNQTEIAL